VKKNPRANFAHNSTLSCKLHRTGVEATVFTSYCYWFFCVMLRGRLTTCRRWLLFFVAKILKIYLLEHMHLEEQGVIHMNLGSWK